MSHVYTGPDSNARNNIGAILDKAHQLPAKGMRVGAGRHVPMPEEWDGTGPVPIGWTSYQAHRNGEEAIWLPEPETQSKLNRLTPGERAQLAAARAQTEPHGPEAGGATNAKSSQGR